MGSYRKAFEFYLRIDSQLFLRRRSHVRRHRISIMEFELRLEVHLMRMLERRFTYRSGRWETCESLVIPGFQQRNY